MKILFCSVLGPWLCGVRLRICFCKWDYKCKSDILKKEWKMHSFVGALCTCMPKLDIPWNGQRSKKNQYRAELSAAPHPRCTVTYTHPPQTAASGSFLTNSKKIRFLNAYLIVSPVQRRGFFTVLCQVSKLTSQQGKHFWEANVVPSPFLSKIIWANSMPG